MKNALIVDYGNRREKFFFCTDVNQLNRDKKRKWCDQTFKDTDWHYYFRNQRIYFKKEKHLVLFLLRWT